MHNRPENWYPIHFSCSSSLFLPLSDEFWVLLLLLEKWLSIQLAASQNGSITVSSAIHCVVYAVLGMIGPVCYLTLLQRDWCEVCNFWVPTPMLFNRWLCLVFSWYLNKWGIKRRPRNVSFRWHIIHKCITNSFYYIAENSTICTSFLPGLHICNNRHILSTNL